MKLDKNKKYFGYGLIGLCSFLIVFFFSGIPFQILKIDIGSISNTLLNIYSLLLNIIVVLIIIILFKDYITKAFKDFMKNKNTYLKKYLKYWFVILIGTVILNGIIISISGNMSGNEEKIRTVLQDSTFYIWLSGVIIAPFLEELTFRLCIKSMIKNKWLFIILSGVLFGSFHLIGNVNCLTDLLFILPYSLPGCIFAYILYDSDNIFNTIGMHMLHNGILMSIEILLLICGVNIV